MRSSAPGTYRLLTYLMGLSVILGACVSRVTAVPESRNGGKSPAARVIAGEEAQALYGIEPDGEHPLLEPSPTSEAWFPRQVWVSASVLPYYDPDPIRILPVYADAALDSESPWIGDLTAGSDVTLLSVDLTGRACFVEGLAAQGWPVRGWVACARLRLQEPTAVPQ